MSQLAMSVEFVELYMDSGSSEITSSVELTKGQDISNCVPFVSWYCGNTDYDGNFPDIWFTDTGTPTIHAERTDYNTEDMYIKAYVVEFDPTKVKVYQGDIPTTVTYNAETSVTITSGTFDQSKTAMVFYYRVVGATNLNYLNQFLIRGQVSSNSTDLTFIKMLNYPTTHYGHYYAFESVDGDFTVNHLTGSTASSTTYEVGYYDWHNTFLLHSYCGGYNGEYLSYITASVYLDGNSRVGIKKYNASYAAYYNIQMIEFSNAATASGTRYCPKVSYYELEANVPSVEIPFEGNVKATDTLSVVSTQNIIAMDSTYSAYRDGIFVGAWLTSSGTKYKMERTDGTRPVYPTLHFVDWCGQAPAYPDLGFNSAPLAPGTTPVKSVENITVTVSANTCISVVQLSKGQDVTNCVVFHSGYCDKSTGYDDQIGSEFFTYFLGNELYVERSTFNSDLFAELSVVEFYSDQVRVQQGHFYIGMNASSSTVTLDEEVDTSKAFLVFGNNFDNLADFWSYRLCMGRIENSTTLGFQRGASHTYPIVGSWYVVEDLGDNWDVYTNTTSLTSAVISYYVAGIHASRHNSFVLFSTSSSASVATPAYATYYADYVSPICPATINKYSASYNAQHHIQVVVFSDNVRLRTEFKQFNFEGTSAQELVDLYTTTSGKAITPMLCNLNGVSGVTSTSNSHNTLAYTKLVYDSNTHQIIASRNNNSSYNITSKSSLIAICWEGATTTSGSSLVATGYFVKSNERYSYTGTDKYLIKEFFTGQDLHNCIPVATYSLGEDSCAEPDKIIHAFWTYPDLKLLHCESNWSADNPGLDLDLTLLEFDPNQVKVQQGFSYMLAGTLTVTANIEAVDISKAFMMHQVMADDSAETSFSFVSVAGKINTTTQLHFERGVSTGQVLIAWYVVECLQDQWSVTHYEINNQNTTTYEYTLPEPVIANRTISWMSYSQEQNSFAPAYSMFSVYPTLVGSSITKLTAARSAVSYEVERMNFSVITFNEDLGVCVSCVPFEFKTTENYVTVSLGKEYDINRTVVWPGQSLPCATVNNTNGSYSKRAFFKTVFQNSTTLLITRESGSSLSVPAVGAVYLVELAIPSHRVSGVVTEEGFFVSRQLFFHKTTTGECLGGTISSDIDGTYDFLTAYSGSIYAVCLDDEVGTSYNGLVMTDVYPGLVEGSWSDIAGWY